jgi:hypothetical protein
MDVGLACCARPRLLEDDHKTLGECGAEEGITGPTIFVVASPAVGGPSSFFVTHQRTLEDAVSTALSETMRQMPASPVAFMAARLGIIANLEGPESALARRVLEASAGGEWSLVSWLASTRLHRPVSRAIQRELDGRGLGDGPGAALRLLRGLASRDDLARMLNPEELMEAIVDIVWGEAKMLQAERASVSGAPPSNVDGAREDFIATHRHTLQSAVGTVMAETLRQEPAAPLAFMAQQLAALAQATPGSEAGAVAQGQQAKFNDGWFADARLHEPVAGAIQRALGEREHGGGPEAAYRLLQGLARRDDLLRMLKTEEVTAAIFDGAWRVVAAFRENLQAGEPGVEQSALTFDSSERQVAAKEPGPKKAAKVSGKVAKVKTGETEKVTVPAGGARHPQQPTPAPQKLCPPLSNRPICCAGPHRPHACTPCTQLSTASSPRTILPQYFRRTEGSTSPARVNGPSRTSSRGSISSVHHSSSG